MSPSDSSVLITEPISLSCPGMVSCQGHTTPAGLERRLVQHAEAHQRAYGVEIWVPKHHHALHLAAQLARHRLLLACFLHERKHKVAKKFARPRTNTVGFANGVLQEVVAFEIYHLHKWQPTTGLTDPTEVPPIVRTTVLALAPDFGDAMQYTRSAVASTGRTCVCGDVVVFRLGGAICVGELLAHVSRADMSCWSLVCNWRITRRDRRSCKCLASKDHPMLVPTSDIEDSAIYARAHSGTSTVLLPMHMLFM